MKLRDMEFLFEVFHCRLPSIPRRNCTSTPTGRHQPLRVSNLRHARVPQRSSARCQAKATFVESAEKNGLTRTSFSWSPQLRTLVRASRRISTPWWRTTDSTEQQTANWRATTIHRDPVATRAAPEVSRSRPWVIVQVALFQHFRRMSPLSGNARKGAAKQESDGEATFAGAGNGQSVSKYGVHLS